MIHAINKCVEDPTNDFIEIAMINIDNYNNHISSFSINIIKKSDIINIEPLYGDGEYVFKTGHYAYYKDRYAKKYIKPVYHSYDIVRAYLSSCPNTASYIVMPYEIMKKKLGVS